MNGQQVLDKNLRSNIYKINIENLNSGTYIVHIISENKIIEKDKLIKKKHFSIKLKSAFKV